MILARNRAVQDDVTAARCLFGGELYTWLHGRELIFNHGRGRLFEVNYGNV